MPTVVESWGENIVCVKHQGRVDLMDALKACEKMTDLCESICDSTDTAYIVHDASALEHAETDYAMVFGKAFLKHRGRNVDQVAVIPKAMMRVLAGVASRVGGFHIHTFKTEDEAKGYISQNWLTQLPQDGGGCLTVS